MRWGATAGLILVLLLASINAGALIDAITYRHAEAQARALLPSDWRDSATMTPPERLRHLRHSRSPSQVRAAEVRGATLRPEAGRVVLVLPIGFDTEALDLVTGCFRFARRQISFIVWQYATSIGCL